MRGPARTSPKHWCECGNEKSVTRAACDRCTYLDGYRMDIFELIQLLREVSGGFTVKALAFELKRDRESVNASLRSLMQKGRVTRVTDADGGDDEARGRPSFVYRLMDTGRAA